MRFLTGFSQIASAYDGFVLDLWGVIHDGVNAFPHAVDCLAELRDAGKKTLLLSNVPRPNDAVRTMMRRMGIDDAHYTDAGRRCAALCNLRRMRGGPRSANASTTSARSAIVRCWRVCLSSPSPIRPRRISF
ncbi:MAG: hypothetical protein ABSA58_22865 [Acetobacteraceae bacterium]